LSKKKTKLNIYGEPKTHWQNEADRVWGKVAELKDKGVFTEVTEEEKLDEPSALANSQYRNEYLTEDEKLRIQKEIEIVKNSNTSSKKKGATLQNLQKQLNNIDNQITY